MSDLKHLPVGVSGFITSMIGGVEHVLLLKRGENCRNAVNSWALPGGSVDFNETPRQAIVREVKEETNLDIQEPYWGLEIGHISYVIMSDRPWLNIGYYINCSTPGKVKNLEPHKHQDLQWFRLTELPANTLESVHVMALQYLKGEIKPILVPVIKGD